MIEGAITTLCWVPTKFNAKADRVGLESAFDLMKLLRLGTTDKACPRYGTLYGSMGGEAATRY